LFASVQKGEFRQDLYYRLIVACIHLPPLNDRGRDVILLAEQFLQEFCQRFNISVPGFTRGAEQLLLEYPWPGNVRELAHAIERAIIISESKKITKENLQESLKLNTKFEKTEKATDNGVTLKLPPGGATLNDIDNCAIRVTLKLVNGNKRKAARMLGISPPRLYRKIEQINKSYGPIEHVGIKPS
jgi:DNA-binding NtrC family response regulator